MGIMNKEDREAYGTLLLLFMFLWGLAIIYVFWVLVTFLIGIPIYVGLIKGYTGNFASYFGGMGRSFVWSLKAATLPSIVTVLITAITVSKTPNSTEKGSMSSVPSWWWWILIIAAAIPAIIKIIST